MSAARLPTLTTAQREAPWLLGKDGGVAKTTEFTSSARVSCSGLLNGSKYTTDRVAPRIIIFSQVDGILKGVN